VTAVLWLVPVGLAIGAYGTLIGAGGGFVLVPLLLLAYPGASPETVASISLAVVFFNALVGSLAYARMGRIDYPSGALFAAATVPGAILGALTTAFIPRRLFDGVLGGLLVLGAAALVLRRPVETATRPAGGWSRVVVERDGTTHAFTYDPRLGAAVSVVVGYLSSVFGIGGGVLHVPILARLLHFPIHVATATSHFTLAVMALTATVVHVVTGAFHQGFRRTAALAIGVVLGAPLGAWLSRRLHGQWILRNLALALALVGLRLVVGALAPGLLGGP
jgi:uncharacterized membrane protein YfcA